MIRVTGHRLTPLLRACLRLVRPLSLSAVSAAFPPRLLYAQVAPVSRRLIRVSSVGAGGEATDNTDKKGEHHHAVCAGWG